MGIVDIFRSDQATVVWLPFSTTMYDAALQKNLHFICHFCRGNEIFSSNCCCILALPQGLLKEVPIYFKFFAVKVVGQTIQACSNTKMSKMQSNGITKLGLVKSLGLYCNLAPNKSQKSKQKLVSGFQINFLCIDPDQVNHLKDLRGAVQKIWGFHLPQRLYKGSIFGELIHNRMSQA